jgi:hypothetical protein
MRKYISELGRVYTWRFIILLFFTQALLKGLAMLVFTEGIFPWFKSLSIGPVQLQLYAATALSPWLIKALIGVLSDLLTINGLHKRYVMLFAIVVGIVGGVVLVATNTQNPAVIAFLLLMIHFEIAISDMIVEGMSAEIMRKNPQSGSDIITLSNGFQQTGMLVAILFLGPLSDLKLFRVTNLIAVTVLLTPLVPTLFGWLPEVKKDTLAVVTLDTAKIKKDWAILSIIAMSGIAAPAIAIITTFASKIIGLICAIVVIIGTIVASYMVMPNRIISHIALYQVLTQLSRINVSTVLDFFFTADPNCLPGGPDFSYKFYLSITGIVGTAISLLAVIIYQLVFSNWNYRSVLLFTTILSGIAGIFDFIIVMRWNIIWGISDAVFFLVGDDGLHGLVEMLYWIPSSSIIGKVCPAGMEVAAFAFLASISNFGRLASSIASALLTEASGIRTDPAGVGGCEWSALPWLILFGHIGCMLSVSIPAAIFLIPNRGQREDLLHDPTNGPEEDRKYNPLMVGLDDTMSVESTDNEATEL